MEKEDIVRHIAQLVRISFTDAETEKFGREFRAILDFVGKLNEVDVERVDPIAHITGRENARREDALADDGGAVLPKIAPDLLEEQAPGHTEGEVRVPRVLQ